VRIVLQGKKVVVTGGCGFIGSHLAEELSTRNEVIVIDDLSVGTLENLNQFKDRITFLRESVLNLEALKAAFHDVDYVFHMASLVSVPESIQDPLRYMQVNVQGTLNALIAAREKGVRRFIYPSSSSVYGTSQELPKREEMKLEPATPYAVTKATGEFLCKVFNDLYDLETVSLRYFNVFGPRQNPSSPYAAVIPKFIDLMLSNRRPIVFGDGNQSRDFVYVKDAVLAANLAATAKKAAGEVINIATGERTTINELVQKINRVLKTELKSLQSAPRPGDITESYADIAKARRLIGYEPKCDINDGLRLTISSFMKRKQK